VKNDQALRQQLIALLESGEAHAQFDDVVKDLPHDMQGMRPKGGAHSPWEVLEHLRIAQWDILEFAINAKHESPEFPAGYWPEKPAPPDERAWGKSVRAFRGDLKRLIDLVADESTDLFAKIPHGSGQTILRQALLTADHNAYHLGQLVEIRRALGVWK
jgi:hypothetical protein